MTTKEMAEIIGISRITLSKYLNGKGGISKKSADKIDRYLQLYNFTPNIHARSLAGKKERIISFVTTFSAVSDGVSRISSHFATMFTNHILAQAKTFDYKVLVSITDMEHAAVEVEQLFSSSLIQGAILFGLEQGSSEFQRLYERNWPLVLVNQEDHPMSERCSVVNMDDQNSVHQAFDLLYDMGHTRFLSLDSNRKRLPALRRSRGVEQALEDLGAKGVSCLRRNANFKEDVAFDLVRELYQETADPPTAIIAANDLSAIGAINALSELGKSVPEDVSVIGFDDIPISGYFTPALSTFRADYEQMAQDTIKELVRLIEEPEAKAQVIEIPMEFVRRDSIGPN